MKRLVLLLLLFPLLLVLGAAVLAPKLAPAERLRAEAVAALQNATGHEPRVGGDVEFVILPWPSIRLTDIAVGQPAEMELVVPAARIELDVLPLLTGHAKTERIVLSRPRLFLPGRSWPGDEAIAALATDLGQVGPAVSLRIDDGVVLVRRPSAPEVLLRDVSGDFRWRGGSILAAEGAAEWHGERLEFEAGLADLAQLANGGVGRLRLSLAGAPGSTGFAGTLRLAGTPVAEGDLRIEAPAARDLMTWLGASAPTEGGFGALSLRGKALLSSGSAALREARLELDGNRSDGGFILRHDLGRTVVQGSFASARLDLSHYGRIALSGPDGEWSRMPLDVAPLGALDLDLRLSAGEVRVGDTAFEAVAASALLKGGKLALTVGEASAWGGIFQASASIAPPVSGTGADVRVELEGTDVDLEASLADLFKLQRLSGTGTFHVALAGTGRDVAGIVQNLGGTVALSAAPGALLGVDVQRVLDRLERSPLSGMGSLRGGRTPFDTLEAAATVAQGVAHVDQLDLASPAVRIALTGDISLFRRVLDLKGTTRLVGGSATPTDGFELPFVVQGPWGSPFVLPDPQALIRHSGAARPLLGTRPAAIGVASPATP